MRANESALHEEKATAAQNIKVGLIRTPNLTSIFSKTIIDRAKQFSPKKITFQDKQVGWFSPHFEN